jgi:hypothetical protein
MNTPSINLNLYIENKVAFFDLFSLFLLYRLENTKKDNIITCHYINEEEINKIYNYIMSNVKKPSVEDAIIYSFCKSMSENLIESKSSLYNLEQEYSILLDDKYLIDNMSIDNILKIAKVFVHITNNIKKGDLSQHILFRYLTRRSFNDENYLSYVYKVIEHKEIHNKLKYNVLFSLHLHREYEAIHYIIRSKLLQNDFEVIGALIENIIVPQASRCTATEKQQQNYTFDEKQFKQLLDYLCTKLFLHKKYILYHSNMFDKLIAKNEIFKMLLENSKEDEDNV